MPSSHASMPHAIPIGANVSRYVATVKACHVSMWLITLFATFAIGYDLYVERFFCLFQFRIEMLLAHLITELDYNWFKFRQTATFDHNPILSVKYQCESKLAIMNHEWQSNEWSQRNGDILLEKRISIFCLNFKQQQKWKENISSWCHW